MLFVIHLSTRSVHIAGVTTAPNGAFSNSTVRVLMQIAEGDLVATQWQITATQTGNYLGHAPSGKTVTWTGVSIDRFENGKIAESWVNWEKYSLFEGLGLLN